ncbi:MAG: hypothetical protein HY758_10130 [Nitrospirae bacterium]|nr:hypothetical protein [Nitrospirota bacterium]
MKNKISYLILFLAALLMCGTFPAAASAVCVPSTEICNGLDDDCDGAIDEGNDADADGISDICDNCINIPNPDQAESDGAVPGMRAYWKFEEGQGFVGYDTVKLNDGTIYNATWGTGQINGALWFKGAQRSDVTIVDNSGNLSITGKKMSIEVWVYGEDTLDHYAPEWATIGIKSSYGCEKWVKINNVWTCIDTDGDGNNYHWYDDGYGLYYQPQYGTNSSHMAFFINHYDNNKGYNASFAKNAWSHIVGTYDGDLTDGKNIKVYVNGVEGMSGSYTENIVNAWVRGGPFEISGT